MAVSLSCKKSVGRQHRHSAVNNIIHRALIAAHVSSRLDPSGLFRSDGKRPDGVSIDPWRCTWPCSLILVPVGCNLPRNICSIIICNCGAAAGAVAEQAEVNKQRIKYINTLTRLDYCHFIILVAKETAGVFGPRTTEFLKDLGHRIKQVSGEANSC